MGMWWVGWLTQGCLSKSVTCMFLFFTERRPGPCYAAGVELPMDYERLFSEGQGKASSLSVAGGKVCSQLL